MTAAQPAASAASRVFNTTVSATGITLGTGSLLVVILGSGPHHLIYFLCAPLVMVMSRFPMLIGRTSGGIEIGFDSCVMIFLALSVTTFEAHAIWCLGVVLAQLTAEKRTWVKFFNTGLGMMAGGITIALINATRGPSLEVPRALLAIVLAAALYFTVDFVLSAVAVSLHEGTSVWRELTSQGVLTALGVFLAIDSIGYQAASIVGRVPWWSASLLCVPIATIMVAARARSRGAEHARRLDIMFEAAIGVQASAGRSEVMDTLGVCARELLLDSRVRIGPVAPQQDEIGVRVRNCLEGEEIWVIGPARLRARSTSADDQQALEALVAVVDEALARLVVIEEMAHLTRHDVLTGLGNRAMFLDRVEHALTMHRRRGGQLAVLFCDLDSFKRINDSHGHAAGDELLLEVATRISSCVREEDTVARLGGDEFVVLLEEIDDTEAIEATCRRLLAALRRGTTVGGQEVFVTATIGVALFTGLETAETMLSNADLAMYHAKSRGKDRAEMFELSLSDERVRRLDLIEALRLAITNRDLQVHYQPIVNMSTGEVEGVEALARWWRDGAWVPPDTFIPVAEESGLIVRLGDLILDLVTADAPRLRSAAGREISISINISAQQLKSDLFVDQVCKARAAMGDIHLILEVTERDFVSDDPRTLAQMIALAAQGIEFAVDDFGIGYSSIGYLRRLPVHIVKIDKSFVDNIDQDDTACSLVQSMATMVQGLGLVVVVEGVERSSQLEHLRSHTLVTKGQGYLFGRPARCEVMMEALERRPTAALT